MPSHCWSFAISTSKAVLAARGQSSAVAVQYMESAQQYQPSMGQQPPGHMVGQGSGVVDWSMDTFTSSTLLAVSRRKEVSSVQGQSPGSIPQEPQGQQYMPQGQHPQEHSTSSPLHLTSPPEELGAGRAGARRHRRARIAAILSQGPEPPGDKGSRWERLEKGDPRH